MGGSLGAPNRIGLVRLLTEAAAPVIGRADDALAPSDGIDREAIAPCDVTSLGRSLTVVTHPATP